MIRILVLASAALSALLFAYTLQQIFYVSPLDAVLFVNQKIFYYHVPNAFMLFAAVITCGVASLLYLKRRDGKYDDVALAAAELAVMFGAIVLVTGSIWGRAAWGVWWEWDARLTTSLLLWMMMLGYVLVRKYGGPGSELIAAGSAVFFMAGVPLVYFSVRLWRTLHPSNSVVPKLQEGMREPFWMSVLLFLFVFFVLLIARIEQARAQRRVREVRELAVDAGIL